MLSDILRDVIVLVAGKPAEPLSEILNSRKHVNEFLIAKKLDLTINQTRNLLYKISDRGLLSFQKKKDKKKGWFTYFWKIDNLKALEFYRGLVIKRIGNLENQLKSRETKQFFVCETCGIELTEENALLHDFTCNECGKIYTQKDNTKVIKELNNELEKLKEKLLEVEKDILTEESKHKKSIAREVAKEKKEREEKRAAARAKRKLAKKKEERAKGIIKKSPKKKVVKKKTSNKKLAKKKVAKKKRLKKSIIKKKLVKEKFPKKKVVKKKTSTQKKFSKKKSERKSSKKTKSSKRK